MQGNCKSLNGFISNESWRWKEYLNKIKMRRKIAYSDIDHFVLICCLATDRGLLKLVLWKQ